MSELFGRRAVLEVGPAGGLGLRVDTAGEGDPAPEEGLRVAFEVAKTIHSSANTATVQVYNVSEASRTRFVAGAVLRLSAGYGDLLELVYEGAIERARTARSTDGHWVTTAECGDGVVEFAAQTVNQTFPAGRTVRDVVLAVAKKMTEAYPDYKQNPVKFDRQPKKKKASRLSVKGLERDLVRLESSLREQGFSTTLRRALSVTGSAREVLDELGRRWRFFWSVQDGTVQVVAYGATTAEAVKLSPETGLVEVPEVTEHGVKVKCFLIPRVRPGGALVLESETVTGQFRVESVKIRGDTRGSDWFTEAEARSL